MSGPRVGLPHTIRFRPDVAQALYRMAVREGKSHSELVREIVSKEIARREGRCPACEQAPPDREASP